MVIIDESCGIRQRRLVRRAALIACAAAVRIRSLLISGGCIALAGLGGWAARHLQQREEAASPIAPPPASATAAARAMTDGPLTPSAQDERKLVLAQFLDRSRSDRLDEMLQELIPTAAEQLSIIRVARDTSDIDAVRNVALDLLERGHSPQLIDLLMEQALDTRNSVKFRSFAVEHLGLLTRADPQLEAPRGFLRSLLNQPDGPVRREALLALARVNDSAGLAAVEDALSDEDHAATRAMAIGVLVELNLKTDEHLRRIRPLIYAADERIRVAAINALGQWRDIGSRPAIDESTRSSSTRVARAATIALRRIDTAGAVAQAR